MHRNGITYHESDAVLKVRRNQLPVTRFGFSIGLKVHKKASTRNLLKRRLRVIAAAAIPRLKTGYDVAIIAKAPLKQLKFMELKERVRRLFERAKLYT